LVLVGIFMGCPFTADERPFLFGREVGVR
jgi:hypothetical protein